MTGSSLRFPDFSLPNQYGIQIGSTDLAGRWVVLYIYPQDDTPGCTFQAKAFNEAYSQFQNAGVEIIGLNQNDISSHLAFCNKFAIRFNLLADTAGTLLRTLRVGISEYKGTRYWDRTTFVIDPTGMIRKCYKDVDPVGHEKRVLEDIRMMIALDSEAKEGRGDQE